MANIEILKKELIGEEMSLVEMDNRMVSFGYPTEFDTENEKTLLDNGSASYYIDDNSWMNVEFDVINYNEETPEDSEIRITNIEEI